MTFWNLILFRFIIDTMDCVNRLQYSISPAVLKNSHLNFPSNETCDEIENQLSLYTWFEHTSYCYGHRIIDHFYPLWILIRHLNLSQYNLIIPMSNSSLTEQLQ